MFAAPNLLLTPTAQRPVTFDAVGTGFSGSVLTTSTATHNATAGSYVLVFCDIYSTFTMSDVKYNGVSMTRLHADVANSSTLSIFGIANVAGGSKTISLTPSSNNIPGVIGSVSYLGVNSVGTPQTVNNTSTQSMSHAMTCAVNEMIVQAFGVPGNTITTSGSTNHRYNTTNAGTAGLNINDASVSSTFSGTESAGITAWQSAAVVLSP